MKKADLKSALILIAAIAIGILIAVPLVQFSVWLIGLIVVLVVGIAIGFWLHRTLMNFGKSPNMRHSRQTSEKKSRNSRAEKYSDAQEAEVIPAKSSARKAKNG